MTRGPLLLASFAFAWFVILAWSAMSTMHPLVLSDEANYLLPTLFGYRDENFRRWSILEQIPNALYYWIYRPRAGMEPYTWAKLLNAAFIAASAAPAYAVARMFLERGAAAAIAAVAIAIPMSSFARYFMPESLFYFGFWCVMLALLRGERRGWTTTAAAMTGIAAGLLSLVKPHAAALGVGIAVYYALGRHPIGIRIARAGLLIAFFFLARAVAGATLGVGWDIPLSGPSYSRQLSWARLAPGGALLNLGGHVAALVALAALPLAAIGAALARRGTDRSSEELRDFLVLVACVLGALLAMTAAYSAMIQVLDPANAPLERLAGRYHVYALPLAMIAYAALLQRGLEGDALFAPAALAGFAALTLAAAVVLLLAYDTTVVDFPDVAILVRSRLGLIVLGAAALAALLFVRFAGAGPQVRARMMPLLWWAAVAVSTSLILASPLSRATFAANAIDAAMMEDPRARALVGREDGLVVGRASQRGEICRVLFHLRSRSRALALGPGERLQPKAIPADVKWLLLLPGIDNPLAAEPQRVGPLTLVQRASAR